MTVNHAAFEFDDRTVFRDSSIRLHAALLARGNVNIPAPAALCDSLCEWYEMQDFQLARALLRATPPLAWHVIRIGPAGEALTKALDVVTIAPSLERAFAGLQIHMDQERVFPDEIIRTEHGIFFHAQDGGLLASIESVPVEPADLQKRERVNDLMRGQRMHGDSARFVKRLSSLPGFQGLQQDHPVRPDDDPRGAMAVTTVHNQCVAMRQMLTIDHGIVAAQHEAQALVAVTFGAADWAHYIARVHIAPESLTPAAIVQWPRGTPVSHARVTLYSTVAEAVFAFSQFCHHSMTPLFPVDSGVSPTGYCHGPWLQADEAPPEEDWRTRLESAHQCSHLSLLQCDAKSELRARTLLSDAVAFPDRIQAFFVTGGSTHDRLRASNRRCGIATAQELFLGDWLITHEAHDTTPEGRYLTLEKFRGTTRVLTERVKLYKSACVREANGRWCMVTEYGRKDVVMLDGLTESQVQRMAAKFAVTCTARHDLGAPDIHLSN